jgi:hypothetical protein
VRMVVSGSIVERCDTDEIPAITAARLRSRPPGLAVGSVNLNHLHHFRTFGQHLRARYPALAVSGMWAPDPADIESCSDTLVAGIRAARTDILVVSVAKSRRERWVDRHGDRDGGAGLLAVRWCHRFPRRQDPPSSALDAANGARVVLSVDSRTAPAGPPVSAARPARPAACDPGPAHLRSRVYHAGTPSNDAAELPSPAAKSGDRVTEKVASMTTMLRVLSRPSPLDGQPARAARQRRLAAGSRSIRPVCARAVRHARSSLPRTQNGPTWQQLVRHEVHMVTGDTTNRESDELPLM